MIFPKLPKARYFFALSTVVLVGISLRFVRLDHIPVFADEAIYIRWSQVMRAEATLRFLPLSDGKQPLFMWATIPFLKLFSDPLLAGRTLSVVSGGLGIIGVAVLAYVLSSLPALALFASILFALSPYTFFFDRFALVDSLLSTLILWTTTFSVITAKTRRFDMAMLTGFLLGFSLITKSPAIFATAIPVMSILFFTHRKTTPAKLILLACIRNLTVTYLIGFGIYNILRLGPEFHQIALRNKDYIFSLAELARHPTHPLFANLRQSLTYFSFFLTLPLLLLWIGSVALISYRRFREPILFLTLLAILPNLAMSGTAKVLTARYLLYTVPYFLIGISYPVYLIYSKLSLLTFPVIFFYPLIVVFRIMFSPESLEFPRSEKSGYFENWTAGYGIKNVAKFLIDRSRSAPTSPNILVGTEGYFGTLPDGLQIYLNDYKNVRIIGTGLYPDSVPQALLNSLVDNEVYFVINDTRLKIASPAASHLRLIESFPKSPKPDGQTEHLLFFKLEPSAID